MRDPLEPGESFAELLDTLIDAAVFDFPVTDDNLGPGRVARDRNERQRLVAAVESAFDPSQGGACVVHENLA
jgi:hypothetical protein